MQLKHCAYVAHLINGHTEAAVPWYLRMSSLRNNVIYSARCSLQLEKGSKTIGLRYPNRCKTQTSKARVENMFLEIKVKSKASR